MKYTASSLLALGLAGSAKAQWQDWSSAGASSSQPVNPVGSSSSPAAPWGGSSSSSASTPAAPTGQWGAPSTVTTTSVSTTTVTATTTVYASTVFVGPGACTATVTVTAGGNGKGPGPAPAGSTPAAPVNSSPAAPAGGSSPAAPAGGWSSTPAAPAGGSSPAAPAGSSPAGGYGQNGVTTATSTSTTYVTVVPTAAGSGWGSGSWPEVTGSWNPNMPGASIISVNPSDWSLAPSDPTTTANAAAPTYSGWGDWSGNGTSGGNGTGPAQGSGASNVTAPFQPLKENSCNGPNSRSQWCQGFSIDSDYYNTAPQGQLCPFTLDITNAVIAGDGTPRQVFAVNGQVPGPLIECNWGDLIQVTVNNHIEEAVTIHWHGIFQKGTNDQDGVPGITECAVAPGNSRQYTFKADQYGTGWYHSHAASQYGDGIRGPLVIHGPATANYDIDMGTVMMDDTFGTAGNPVTAAAENELIAKTGPQNTWNYLLNGANVSPDLSQGKHALWSVQPGKKHLFRLINSASQNMWSVRIDDHTMTVIAADWVPIVPYETEWVNIGIGQRYDVVVEMNQPVAGYFLRAVTQTLCPSACQNDGLGNANGIILYEGAPATLPTSTYGANGTFNNAICQDEPLASLVPHFQKSAGSPTSFLASASNLPAGGLAQLQSSDDGQVFRWFINNGAMNANYSDPTLNSVAHGDFGGSNTSAVSNGVVLGGTQDDWVYFVIQNQFFAFHPMHLHGHDMSVLGQGTSPWNPSLVSTLNFNNPCRRDTAMLAGSSGGGPSGPAPPGYTVIGFQTDNPGAWIMHCHIIWHVDGGLALQFVERPNDITATQYTSTSAWNNECSAWDSYLANGGQYKYSWESGLKARSSPYFDGLLNARSDNVVRRSESVEKRYLDTHLKRGLGDGFKPRNALHH